MSGAITATTVAVAALSTAEIFTAVAITGAVIGAVGTVTGIKPLQYAGMALGAIGGIGALAVSAGIIGGEALGAGASLADAGGLASDGGFAGAVGSDVAAGGLGDAVALQGAAAAPATALNTTPDIIDGLTGQVRTPDAALTGPLANAQGPDVAPTAAINTGQDPALASMGDMGPSQGVLSAEPTKGGALDPNSVVPGTMPPPTPSAPSVTTPTGAATSAPATGSPLVMNGQPVTAIPLDTPYTTAQANALSGSLGSAAPPNAFDKIIDVLAKPGVGTLAAGAIQAGASFIAGATSSLTPAQVNALNAQAAANQAAANLSTRQQANMASGIPVASRPGLVNSPPVTGAPA